MLRSCFAGRRNSEANRGFAIFAPQSPAIHAHDNAYRGSHGQARPNLQTLLSIERGFFPKSIMKFVKVDSLR
jgi:hypothetical protein